MARYSGYAANLLIDVSSTYTEIAQVIEISGPTIKASLIETTDRDSSGKRTYIAGLIDSGKVKFKVHFDPDNVLHSMSATNGLGKLAQAGTATLFKIEFPDTTPVTAIFTAIIEDYSPEMPLDGAMTANCTLQISGGITWA